MLLVGDAQQQCALAGTYGAACHCAALTYFAAVTDATDARHFLQLTCLLLYSSVSRTVGSKKQVARMDECRHLLYIVLQFLATCAEPGLCSECAVLSLVMVRVADTWGYSSTMSLVWNVTCI